MRKKKVLFFLQSAGGGAERVTIIISKYLDMSRYDVVYCIIEKDDSNIHSFLPEDSVVKQIYCKNYKDSVTSKLFKMLLFEKPDIVFSSVMPLNYRLIAASLLVKRKIKVIIRNDNYIETQSFIQKLRLRLFYKFATIIVAQTEEMRQGLVKKLKLRPEDVITLTNPIDKEVINRKIAEPSPYSSSNNRIKYVASGRFHSQKGFDILVKSYALVRRQLPNSELYVLGRTDGGNQEYYEKICRQVKTLGIEKYVHFLGFKDNPFVYVKYADCFVLSSRNEGLPNVLLEAQYLGVPTAATRCIPVIARIVKEGENGYLADSENPAQLAAAMLKALLLKKPKSHFVLSTPSDFINLFS
nr:glycosyltransferase [uncultured Draconibacterium sp.]